MNDSPHDSASIQHGRTRINLTGNMVVLIAFIVGSAAVNVLTTLSVSWQLTEYKISLEARLSAIANVIMDTRRVQAELDKDINKIFLLFAGHQRPRTHRPYSPE